MKLQSIYTALIDIGSVPPYHGSIGDQTNERIWRQQGQAHDERILEGLQTVIFLAGIHNVEEDWGGRGRACQLILDGGARGVQLWGYCVFRNILIVRRKGV